MLINTKELKKGILLINDELIQKGMSISEFEEIIEEKLEYKDDDGVGCFIGEDITDLGKTISIYMWFIDNKIDKYLIELSSFYTDVEAISYLDLWLKNRGLKKHGYDLCKNPYYKTEKGYLAAGLDAADFDEEYTEVFLTIELIDYEPKLFIYEKLPNN